MKPLLAAPVCAVLAACSISMIAVAGPAGAAPPFGTCTKSYDAYTFEQLAFDPAAQAIFSVIDTNNNGLVCFKLYPNGPHAGHFGNLVDDKAAPHA